MNFPASITNCLVFLVIACTCFGFSQDSEGDRILKEAILFATKLQDFEADFYYEFQSPQRRSMRRSGRIQTADKGSRYSILVEGHEIYMDGQTMWVYSSDHNEVVISPHDESSKNLMESIFDLFIFKDFSKYLGTEMVLGYECDKVYVKIQDDAKDVNYHEAYVWIGQSPRPRMIEKVTFLNGRNATTSYYFTEIRPNVGLSIDQFRFFPDNYPQITIYDERE